jgi:hypothetical protein
MTETLYIIETLNRTIDTLVRAGKTDYVDKVVKILNEHLNNLIFSKGLERSE